VSNTAILVQTSPWRIEGSQVIHAAGNRACLLSRITRIGQAEQGVEMQRLL